MRQLVKNPQDTVDVLVLGAGLCGLVIAQELMKARNTSWLLVDKGRAVGGRVATRRIEEQKFDHGAQFLTARSQLFKQMVASWLQAGIVKQWTTGFRQHYSVDAQEHPMHEGYPRYIGIGGMNQIAKHLAAKLPTEKILINEKIIEIEIVEDHFLLRSEKGLEVTARTLVITAPVPQTLDLLKSTPSAAIFDDVSKEFAKIDYDPCLAILAFFVADELPLDALPIQNHKAAISFLADNYSKGLTSQKGCLTVHLGPRASRDMFAADDRAILDFVCQQIKELFGLKVLTVPIAFSIQRWRYASPQSTLDSPYLEWVSVGSSGPRIFFAGEAFAGPKIEGAVLSGHAVAQKILE